MRELMTLELNHKLTVGPQLGQQSHYAEFCLPLTMKLAKRNKARILPMLDDDTIRYPFADRVLIWLHPIWKEDIVNFHYFGGLGMDEMFRDAPHKLLKFDKHYRKKLKERLIKV